jgi:hypothetical protein
MRFISSFIFLALPILLSSCAVGEKTDEQLKTEEGIVAGGIIGALIGGVLGHAQRDSAEGAGVAAILGYQIPSFPWPPPLASAIEVIPRELLKKKQGPTRLRDIDKEITEALKQNGYYESSYYSIPEGFALATRIEQIEEDGSPKKEPHRWNLKLQPINFSLANYLKRLFLATPGYYRIIVFVITPYALAQSTSEPTPIQAIKWFSAGYNLLPESIGNKEFSQSYACTALIYEFERETESAEPRFRQPGRIPGHIHLVKAGIWRSLEQ